NSRIVVRLKSPNHILYLGFSLMALACAGMLVTEKITSHWIVAVYMMLGGTGLGFVMPNLTVFAQETAGRALLGISTALLQSVRMIGGMFGLALVGTVVGHYHAGAVRASIPQGEGTSWMTFLEDPQVLVSQSVQNDFMAQMQGIGMKGDALIEIARASLVSAVHGGLALTLLAALIALAWVYRMPHMSFSRTADTGQLVKPKAKGRP